MTWVEFPFLLQYKRKDEETGKEEALEKEVRCAVSLEGNAQIMAHPEAEGRSLFAHSYGVKEVPLNFDALLKRFQHDSRENS